MSEYQLPEPEDWFDNSHAVEHVSQGDIYLNVPFDLHPRKPSRWRPRGASKKPDLIKPSVGPVIVVTYTCRIVAQPPGTDGYSHPFRQVAPIRPLSTLLDRKRGLKDGIARRVVESNSIEGLCYVPILPEWNLEDSGPYEGHGVAQLYAMYAVTQSMLDDTERVARLSEAGQRIFAARAMSVVGPMNLDPWQAEMAPDRSDSWAVVETS